VTPISHYAFPVPAPPSTPKSFLIFRYCHSPAVPPIGFLPPKKSSKSSETLTSLLVLTQTGILGLPLNALSPPISSPPPFWAPSYFQRNSPVLLREFQLFRSNSALVSIFDKLCSVSEYLTQFEDLFFPPLFATLPCNGRVFPSLWPPELKYFANCLLALPTGPFIIPSVPL